MSGNSENSAVATGLEKVNFPSNKLPQNCTHLTCKQSNSQNSPRQASTVYEPKTSRCSSWIYKRQKNQRSNCQHPLDNRETREFQKNICFCFMDYTKAFDCVDHNKLKNSERDGKTRPPALPLEKPICRSRSNSENWTWNNRLVPNRERSMSRLYIVTLLI